MKASRRGRIRTTVSWTRSVCCESGPNGDLPKSPNIERTSLASVSDFVSHKVNVRAGEQQSSPSADLLEIEAFLVPDLLTEGGEGEFYRELGGHIRTIEDRIDLDEIEAS